MPSISAGDLTKLRSNKHRTKLYLSVHLPDTAFTALVNNASIARGETSIAFDGGSGGDYANVEPGMELWVGSSSGVNDKGRVRIRSLTTVDGVTGTVTIADNSVDWSDNDHISIKMWFPLSPRYPFIESDGTFKKDGDVAYTDENSQPPPVCIAGPHRAAWLGQYGFATMYVDLANSYAIADGASISGYAASAIHPSSPGLVSTGVDGAGLVTIVIQQAGQYWLKFTVTDSNGKTQDAYRLFIIVDQDASRDTAGFYTDFGIGSIDFDFDAGGWKTDTTFRLDIDETAVPSETIAILWGENKYGDYTGYPGDYHPNGEVAYLVGYLRNGRIDREFEDGTVGVAYEMTTIQALLENHFMYSVSLESVNSTPDAWYKYEDFLTNGRGVHHLWKYHSTLLEVADVFDLTRNTDPRAYAEFEDGNLYSMADSMLRDGGTREHVICDKFGRIRLVEEQQLLPDSERSGLAVVHDVDDKDLTSRITILHEPEPRVPFLYLSGFAWNKTFDSDSKPDPTPICAIAPGDKPLHKGSSPIQVERQTLSSQTHANRLAGRFLAKNNNEYPEIRLEFNGNWLPALEGAENSCWQISLLSTSNPRGIVWTNKQIYLKSVSAQYNPSDGTMLVNTVFEPEADGPDGIATTCPTFPDFDGDDWDIPEDENFTDGLYTASSMHLKKPGGDGWAELLTESVQHAYPDPFWTTKQSSSWSNDSIQWRCGVGYIKRSTDGGNNWTTVSPGADPPNDLGDTPAPTVADLTFVEGDAHLLEDQKHIFVAKYQNADNEWRSWLCMTEDDGGNWEWLTIAGGTPDDATVWASSDVSVEGTIALSNNLYIVVYQSSDDGYAVAGDYTDGVWTWGTGVSFDLDPTLLLDYPSRIATVRIDSTTFALSWNPASSNNSELIVGSVSGTTITFGGPATVFTDQYRSGLWISLIDSTHLLVSGGSYRGSIFAVNDGWQVAVVTISGTTISSVGTVHTFDSAEQIWNQHVTVMTSSTRFVSAWMRRNGGQWFGLYGISGTTITELDTIEYDATKKPAYIGGWLNGTNEIGIVTQDIEDDSFTAEMITKTGDSITMVEVGPIEFDVSSFADYFVTALDDGRIAITYRTLDPETGKYPLKLALMRVSRNRILGAVSPIEIWDDIEVSSAFTGVASFSASSIFVPYIPDDSDLPVLRPGWGTIIAGNSIQVIGLSISKLDGITLVVTYHSNGKLLYGLYDLTDGLTYWAHSIICSATDEEFSTKARIAYPHYVQSGSDEGNFILYGLMQDPVGLSGELYLIETENYGLDFAAIDTGFSDGGYVGALFDDFGEMFIIRNLGGSCKLYIGNVIDGFSLASTLNITGVGRNALWYSWFTGELFAGSNVVASVMVAGASGDFASWVDVTYDHPTTNPIKSLFVT